MDARFDHTTGGQRLRSLIRAGTDGLTAIFPSTQAPQSYMDTIKELLVNGTRHSIDVGPERSLLGVLRDELELTGTKYGCGEGQCGACTVLVDGQAARSCLVKVGSAVGKAITTIEGLEKDGQLHPLQAAFLEAGAMQCGYCTAGMIMAGVALLGKNPEPGERDVARALEGNLCRCGTYPRIVTAVCAAARSRARSTHG